MMRNVLLLCLIVLAASSVGKADRIVSVSIPVNSMDSACYPLNDGVWSVSAPPYPLNTALGIGTIINSDPLGAFCLHDHVYSGDNVPDPGRAVVTYEFDEAVLVKQVEVIQHSNGITLLEAFVGDSLGSLASVGSAFGPYGDVTGSWLLTEGESNVFNFGNTQAGRYLQLVIRKTSHASGYAAYQVYPRDAGGVRFEPIPEPATACLLALGGFGLLARRRGR